MKGDFSRLRFPQIKEDSAVLQQQGRVSLDEDWNAQVTLGQDILRDALTDLMGPAGTADESAFAVTPLESLVLDGSKQFLTVPGDESLPFGQSHFTIVITATILPNVTSGTVAALEDGFRLYVTDQLPVSSDVLDLVSDDESDSHAEDSVATAASADADPDAPTVPTVPTTVRYLVLAPFDENQAGSLALLPETDLPLSLAVVFDNDKQASGTIKASYALYVDGVLQSRTSPPREAEFLSLEPASPASLFVGANQLSSGPEDFLEAAVDAVQVWSLSLWQAAVRSLVGRRLSFDEDHLVVYYLASYEEDGQQKSIKGQTSIPNLVSDSEGKPAGTLAVAAAVEQVSFWIEPGRYWVEGRRCVNTYPVAFTHQPNDPLQWNPLRASSGASGPGGQASYLVYLDVWDRWLSALQDPSLREVALGGPDTTGRIENIWQARVAVAKGSDPEPPTPPPPGALRARRLHPSASSVGNLLYRVEIAASGIPFVLMGQKGQEQVPEQIEKRSFAVGTIDTEANSVMTETVSDFHHFPPQQQIVIYWQGDPQGSPEQGAPEEVLPVVYQYNTVARIEGEALILTQALDSELIKRKNGLRILPSASFKWSSQNGCIAFPVSSIQETVLGDSDFGGLVQLSGPGYNGFEVTVGDWLELANDTSDLRRIPEPLYQVAAVDPSALQITLRGWQRSRNTVDLAASQHPLLRLWNVTPDDTGRRVGLPVQPIVAETWTELDHGIEVQFAKKTDEGLAFYRTGDYWTMPVRDVSENSLEWPGGSLHPAALPPEGIVDVRASLAVVDSDGTIHSKRLLIVPSVKPIT